MSNFSRLYSTLLNTGLQTKDNPLYQVIHSLIDEIKRLNALIAANSSSGGGSSTIINNQFMSGMMGIAGEDGADAIIIPGSRGPEGPIVPYFIPDGNTFNVPENDQALFSMNIDNEGVIDVEGYLVEVDRDFQVLQANMILASMDGIDGEDGSTIPGINGINGSDGASGANGIIGPPGMDGDDSDYFVGRNVNSVTGNFSVNTNQFYANAANGAVGINTTSPLSGLHVAQSIVGQGTISVTATSVSIVGTGTQFQYDFFIGDTIVANGETQIIKTIPSNTSMTTVSAWANTFSGVYTLTGGTTHLLASKGILLLGGSSIALAVNTGFLQANRAWTNPLSVNGMVVTTTINKTDADSANTSNIALNFTASMGATNTKNWTNGSLALVGCIGQVKVDNGAAGIATSSTGFYAAITNSSGTATLTSVWGFRMAGITIANSGIITSAAAIAAANVTAATNNTQLLLGTTTIPSGNFGIYSSNTSDNYIAGRMGLGVAAPLSILHLSAGTATANTAPLQLNSGTLETTPRAGVEEFLTDNRYFTITTGAARKAYVFDDGARLTSGKIPVATTNGRLIDSTAALLIAAGTPTIVATTFEKAETGSDANVLTYAVGAGADEFLVVTISTDVSALTGTSVVVTLTWKDSNNATQTSILTLTSVSDGQINIPINAFASSNVVVSTVFVGVSTAYIISAVIVRLK